MIIVTDRQFIIADAVLHMNLTEEYEERGYGKARKDVKVWSLHVTYLPTGGSNANTNRNGTMECVSRFYTVKEAKGAFKEVVRQYREQNPDALYLDKIIEGMIKE